MGQSRINTRSECLTTERLSRFGNRQMNWRTLVEGPPGLMRSRVMREPMACANLMDSERKKALYSTRARSCNDVAGPRSFGGFIGGQGQKIRLDPQINPYQRRVTKDLYWCSYIHLH
jgi:hypothetical protein